MGLYKIDSITDVIHGSIPISGLERMVISSPLFNRMHRILQNSMVYLTFPCNKTKRFEHSIGTMYLAGEMFYHSIVNSDGDLLTNFFAKVDEKISQWYNKIDSSSYSFLSDTLIDCEEADDFSNKCSQNICSSGVSLYKQYTPTNIENKNFFAYIVCFEAVRLAGLLHDVGHLPYSHIMEFAMKSLYFEMRGLDDKTRDTYNQERLDKFLKALEPYYSLDDNDCELHEAIGKKIVGVLKKSIFDCFKENGKQDVKSDSEKLIATMAFDFATDILDSFIDEKDIFSDLHSIISGTIDADRLDYCSRDFYSAGIAKGFIDYDKLFNTYELRQVDGLTNKECRHFAFCPSTKSLQMIEDLLYRRWKIYLEINYHHRVQKIHELMIHSVKQIAIAYLKDNTDDNQKEKSEDNRAIKLGIHSLWDTIGLMKNQKA